MRDEPYAICNVGGSDHRALRHLPACGRPLGQGQIHAEGALVCPYHLWEFDCATGEYDFDPSMRVATYPVKVEGEELSPPIFLEDA